MKKALRQLAVVSAGILLLLSVVRDSFADEWREEDMRREAVFMVFGAMDWAQTRNTARSNGKYKEYNPILGDRPSVREVDRYMLGCAFIHYSIANWLSVEDREIFQKVTIVVQFATVAHNASIGLSMKF